MNENLKINNILSENKIDNIKPATDDKEDSKIPRSQFLGPHWQRNKIEPSLY